MGKIEKIREIKIEIKSHWKIKRKRETNTEKQIRRECPWVARGVSRAGRG